MTSEPGACWADLLVRLGDPDPTKRAAAAVAVSDALGDDGIPQLGDVLAEVARRDAVHPGVADSFYGGWIYGASSFASDADRDAIKRWVLAILGGRPPGALKTVTYAVDGNNLEFHAHEIFEADADALKMLLGWGYVSVVEMALDHTALGRREWIALAETLYARTRRPYLLEAIAMQYGVIHVDLAATARSFILPGGTPAILLASENERFWEARWIFPSHPARLDVTDPHALFAALVTAGLGMGSSNASFNPENAGHLAFPDIPGTLRVASIVRIDTQMMIARNGEDVVAIRIVRTKPAPAAVANRP